MSVELRPARAEDEPFLRRLFATTRHELANVGWSVEQTAAFLRLQFDARHRHYTAQFPDARFDVIEQDGHPIGRLCVHENAHELRIVDIAVLPQSRGRGLGTRLIRAVMDEAAGKGKPVVLHVEQHNRARRLYARLGFEPAGEAAIYCMLRWQPPQTLGTPN